MEQHYDFGSVRTPKYKNEGNLSFLVIYGLSDSQRAATSCAFHRGQTIWKRPLTCF